MSSPPKGLPIVEVTSWAAVKKPFAVLSSWLDTAVGKKALIAGRKRDCSNPSTKTAMRTTKSWNPNQIKLVANKIIVAARKASPTITIRKRPYLSASAPEAIPNTIRGTNPAMPTKAISKAEPVSVNTSQVIARRPVEEPIEEATELVHKPPKTLCLRSEARFSGVLDIYLLNPPKSHTLEKGTPDLHFALLEFEIAIPRTHHDPAGVLVNHDESPSGYNCAVKELLKNVALVTVSLRMLLPNKRATCRCVQIVEIAQQERTYLN